LINGYRWPRFKQNTCNLTHLSKKKSLELKVNNLQSSIVSITFVLNTHPHQKKKNKKKKEKKKQPKNQTKKKKKPQKKNQTNKKLSIDRDKTPTPSLAFSKSLTSEEIRVPKAPIHYDQNSWETVND
jgi:hypothetical protein